MHKTEFIKTAIFGLALRYDENDQVPDYYVDDGIEENGIYYYSYKGEFANATTGNKMGISQRLRRHFGWGHLEFINMTLEGAAGFVVVSAASRPFATRLEDMVWSVQRFLPNITIIIYDIGLEESQAKKVSRTISQISQCSCSISHNLPCGSYQMRKIAGCACARNAGNVFPTRRLQRKPPVSDPGMHHGTCVTHTP